MGEANTGAAVLPQIPTTDAKQLFVSAEQTGTGASQNVAHGLERVPTKVLIYITGGPSAYTQPVITLGAHTINNVVVTVTLDWKFRVLAW